MTYAWHDTIGNVGVAFMVGAYLMLQIGKLDSNDVAYSLFNGVGAALVLLSLSIEFNMSAFVMESFWLLISIYGLISAFKTRRAVVSSQSD